MRNILKVKLLASAMLIADCGLATQALAQVNAAQPPEDTTTVVVTAEKRNSTVQKTPIAVTAISGDQLAARGVTSVSNLVGDVPGLSVRSSGPGQNEFTIRGLSSPAGVAPTVSFYLDETPINPPSGSTAGKTSIDPTIYDLARVEVLRGPQGTLYGASSMGGTIKFVPQAPVIGKFATSAKVGVEATEGGNESTSFNGMINIPLIDGKLALRLVGSVVDRGGWIDRGVVNDFPLPDPSITGSYFTAPRADLSGVTPDKVYKNTNTVRSDTFRAAVLWQPTDRLTITPSFFYQKIRTGAPDSYDESPGTDVHYQPFDIKETYGDEAKIATVKGQYSFDDFDLNSVTSYARRRQTQVQDSSEGLFKSNADFEGLTGYAIADGGLGQASTTESQPVTQFTQEIRLTSTTQSDFSWIVGAYYNRFTSHYQAISITPDAGPILGTTVGYSADLADESSEVAVFASLGYQLTPKLKVTVGARQYSYLDNVSGETGGILGGGVIDAKKAKTSGVNPSFNLSYTPSSNHLLYASVAKGMRQGAAQPATPHICDADVTALGLSEAPTRFDPDYVWNYELGSKNQYFNRKLTLNAAIYRMKWQGVQQYVALPQCGFTYTDNAGEVTVNGVDFEFDARLPAGFGLSGSVGYVDAAFDRDDPRTGTMAGDPLQNVPEWTGNVAFTYDKDFGSDYALKARLGASHVGGSRVVSYDKFQLDGYTLVDGRIGIGKGKWLVSMYVDNLTNERVVLNRPLALTFNVPRLDRLQSSRPRTVGIEFTIKQ